MSLPSFTDVPGLCRESQTRPVGERDAYKDASAVTWLVLASIK